MKLGVVLESLRLSLRQGLPEAARVGLAGLQVDATGDLAPERLSATGRRELRSLLRSFNLELTALNCPLRHGLDVAQNQQPRIEYVRQAMTLAYELGPRLVVVPFPKLPAEDELDRAARLHEALLDLGRHGDRVGSSLALEIGLDPADRVRAYLDRFEVGSLRVNFDPANVIVHGREPLPELPFLAGRLAQVHARDARKASVSRGSQETELGGGDVDWLSLTATLSAIEFQGFLTIEREPGHLPPDELERSVRFLKRMLPPR